jgi:hypothetical protein
MAWWYLCIRKFKSLEKDRIPTKQPTQKISMNIRLLSLKGALRAPVINAYLPRISRIKEPLIPGRIIAQIATDPLRNMFRYEFSEETGMRETNATPTIVPNKNWLTCFDLNGFSIDFEI